MYVLMSKTIFLLLIFGSIFSQSTIARALINPYNNGWSNIGGNVLFTNNYVRPESKLFSTFFDALYQQLLGNPAFKMMFNGRIDNKLATDIGKDIANVLAEEFRLDASVILKEFVNAVTHIKSGSNAETFAKVLASTCVKILMKNNILKSYNDLRRIKSLAGFITGSIYIAAEDDNELEDMLETTESNIEDDASSNTNTNFYNHINYENGLNVVLGTNSRSGNNEVNYGIGMNSGLQFSSNMNYNFDEYGMGLNVNNGPGEGSATNSWQNIDFDPFTDSGFSTGFESTFNQNIDQELFEGSNTGKEQVNQDSETKYESKLGKWSNYETEVDPDTGISPPLTVMFGKDSDPKDGLMYGFNGDDPLKSGQSIEFDLNDDTDTRNFDLGRTININTRLSDGNNIVKTFDPRARKENNAEFPRGSQFLIPFSHEMGPNIDPDLRDDSRNGVHYDPGTSSNTDLRLEDDSNYAEPFNPRSSTNTMTILGDDTNYAKNSDPKGSTNTDPPLTEDNNNPERSDSASNTSIDSRLVGGRNYEDSFDPSSRNFDPNLADDRDYTERLDPQSDSSTDSRFSDDTNYAQSSDPRSSKNTKPRLEDDNAYPEHSDTRSNVITDPNLSDDSDYLERFDPRSIGKTTSTKSADDAKRLNPGSSPSTDLRLGDDTNYAESSDPRSTANTDPKLRDDTIYAESSDPKSSTGTNLILAENKNYKGSSDLSDRNINPNLADDRDYADSSDPRSNAKSDPNLKDDTDYSERVDPRSNTNTDKTSEDDTESFDPGSSSKTDPRLGDDTNYAESSDPRSNTNTDPKSRGNNNYAESFDSKSKNTQPRLANDNSYPERSVPISNTNTDRSLADDSSYLENYDPRSSTNKNPRLTDVNNYAERFDTGSSTNIDPNLADDTNYAEFSDPKSNENSNRKLAGNNNNAERFDPRSKTNTDTRLADDRSYADSSDPSNKNIDPNLAENSNYTELSDSKNTSSVSSSETNTNYAAGMDPRTNTFTDPKVSVNGHFGARRDSDNSRNDDLSLADGKYKLVGFDHKKSIKSDSVLENDSNNILPTGSKTTKNNNSKLDDNNNRPENFNLKMNTSIDSKFNNNNNIEANFDPQIITNTGSQDNVEGLDINSKKKSQAKENGDDFGYDGETEYKEGFKLKIKTGLDLYDDSNTSTNTDPKFSSNFLKKFLKGKEEYISYSDGQHLGKLNVNRTDFEAFDDTKFDFNVRVDSSLDSNTGMNAALDPNIQMKASLDPSAKMKVALDPSAGMKATLDPNVQMDAALDSNVGSDTQLDPNTGMNAALDHTAGLTVISDPNAEIKDAVNPKENARIKMSSDVENSTKQKVSNKQETGNDLSSEADIEKSLKYTSDPSSSTRVGKENGLNAWLSVESSFNNERGLEASYEESFDSNKKTEVREELDPGLQIRSETKLGVDDKKNFKLNSELNFSDENVDSKGTINVDPKTRIITGMVLNNRIEDDPESEKERKLKDKQDNKEELEPIDTLNSPEKSDVIPETRMKEKFRKKVRNNDKFVGEDDPNANSDVKTDEYNDSTNVDPTLTGQNIPNDVDPDFNGKDPRYAKSMDPKIKGDSLNLNIIIDPDEKANNSKNSNMSDSRISTKNRLKEDYVNDPNASFKINDKSSITSGFDPNINTELKNENKQDIDINNFDPTEIDPEIKSKSELGDLQMEGFETNIKSSFDPIKEIEVDMGTYLKKFELENSANTDLEVALKISGEDGLSIESKISGRPEAIENSGSIEAEMYANLSHKELKALFKKQLKSRLKSDKAFKRIFSRSVPQSAVSELNSFIARFLVNAFSLPRPYVLTLENNLNALGKNELTTSDLYANRILISLSNILEIAKAFEPSAFNIQVDIALSAILAGIKNFLGSLKVSGISSDKNPYDSEFSFLNGLEILPYASLDVVLQKYPSISENKGAENFKAKFLKNVLLSDEFSESIHLGIRTSSWKNIARHLGESMAEAFGSFKLSVFASMYENVLLSIDKESNVEIYARAIANATEKTLTDLGYFTLGNPNIKAAVAETAVIKALEKTFCKNNSILNRKRREMSVTKANLDIGNTISETTRPLDIGGINMKLATDTMKNVNVDLMDASLIGMCTNINLKLKMILDSKEKNINAYNNPSLSKRDILNQILSEKLQTSTAMYTAISVAGFQKVVSLIAQSMSLQFGFENASMFSNIYNVDLADVNDKNLTKGIKAIAKATTATLEKSGVLSSEITVQYAEQLSTSIATKFSLLIASSLDYDDGNIGTD